MAESKIDDLRSIGRTDSESSNTSFHLASKGSEKNRRSAHKSPRVTSSASLTRSFSGYRGSRHKKRKARDPSRQDLGFIGDSFFEDEAPEYMLQYMYIPSWTLVAHHRFPTFFWECISHYFDYQAWPEWDALPEKFVQTCQRFQVSPTAIHHYPGWAPIWLYILRKLDERWFKAVVENFFENHTLPTWDELPTSFVQKFEDLRIHERQYFE